MTKTALRPEPLEIIEDLELIRGQPVRADQPAVGFENQWKYVRQMSAADTIEVYVASPQIGPAVKYRRAFSGWLEAKIYFGGSAGGTSVFVGSPDPESVAAFFEAAAPQQFTRFCGLLQPKLALEHVVDRVRSVAALVAIPWTTPAGSAETISGFQLDSPSFLPVLQLPGISEVGEPQEQINAGAKLAEIEQAMKEEHIDDALDLLYAWIDNLLREGRYTVVDSLFSIVDKRNAPVDLILGLLIATLPVKRRAKSRSSFLRDAKRILGERGAFEEGLFDGLD